MRAAQKLIFIAGLGKGAYSKWRTQRLISMAVTVAILAVTAAVVMSALVIGGIYAFYLVLLSQNIDPTLALLFTVLAALFATFGLLQMLRQRLAVLRTPLRAPMSDVIDAFLDGLLTDPRTRT